MIGPVGLGASYDAWRALPPHAVAPTGKAIVSPVKMEHTAAKILVVTGTGTEVGKTITTAAVAAVAIGQGKRVAVVKPVQTGVAPDGLGDVDEVSRLAGEVTVREVRRYSDPLAPNTAARRDGREPLRVDDAVAVVQELAESHDLVVVEGAGGLLAWFDDEGSTLADLTARLDAPLLMVAAAGLGTLNATAMTAEVARGRGLRLSGLVIGSWPQEPDLAARCNIVDLPIVAQAPLLGALPAGAGALTRDRFAEVARRGLVGVLGGNLDIGRFAEEHAAPVGVAG